MNNERNISPLHQARQYHGGFPDSAISTAYENAKAVVYRYSAGGYVYAVAFTGRKLKPSWRYRFANDDACNTYIETWLETEQARIREYKAARALVQAYQHPLRAGQVLYSSWGYEQTNVDFYEVIRALPKSVELRQMAATKRYDGDRMTGTALPDPKHYIGPSMVRRVHPDEIVSIDGHRHAYPWDGKPRTFTEYA